MCQRNVGNNPNVFLTNELLNAYHNEDSRHLLHHGNHTDRKTFGTDSDDISVCLVLPDLIVLEVVNKKARIVTMHIIYDRTLSRPSAHLFAPQKRHTQTLRTFFATATTPS